MFCAAPSARRARPSDKSLPSLVACSHSPVRPEALANHAQSVRKPRADSTQMARNPATMRSIPVVFGDCSAFADFQRPLHQIGAEINGLRIVDATRGSS